ncbi:MAG TPA: thiamine pyrophosphate-binding protein [Pirellulales bacterium]|jgi:benzoylformate decarboxylase|nr:thiamine pyrophosphate-binding protein [Pirellulales bacterium]
MPVLSGSQALLELLAGAGVRYVFGNPGTTELPLIDELARDARFQYVLGLQEIPVMAMADGYAQASRQLAVVNLHASCGLGNAMGMLYNAYRAGTPLLVTAGQSDRRLKFEEPILWSDLAQVARPWTKWSAEVERVQDLPSAVRRAMQTALTPPTGPVFLSLPMDLQQETAELDITGARPLDPRVRPPAAALRGAADVLASAANPAILAGSRVVESGAVDELIAVAEALGAPVYSESATTHGRLPFPPAHPLYGQALPLWSPQVHGHLEPFDVLLVVGMDLLRQYVYFEPARAIPEHARIVHLDEDPWQIGKNYPVEVGLVGDTKAGLAELAGHLQSALTEPLAARAQSRRAAWSERHEQEFQQLRKRAADEPRGQPLSPLALMATIAESLPPGAAVIEEAVTTTNNLLERLRALDNATGCFGHRGWALGWGLGCALGVKLAWPQRPVLALLGEGAAMYGVQGLWTAARYRLPVTFVVCNNAQYRILKIGASQLELPQAQAGQFLGMDLRGPEVDIVALAQSMGVEARRITHADELRQAVSHSLAANDVPRLFDVPIQRDIPGHLGG